MESFSWGVFVIEDARGVNKDANDVETCLQKEQITE